MGTSLMEWKGEFSVKAKEILAKNLKDLRTKRNMSLDEFSEEVGVGRATLYKIENGTTNTTIEVIDTISESLQVPPAQLLSERPLQNLEEIVGTLLQTIEWYHYLTGEEQEQALACFRQLAYLCGKGRKRNENARCI